MEKKPNVLIILADQYRYDAVGAAGYPHMKTPHLDRLAQEGCQFTCMHSHNPVCMPARHDLLLGLPARAHGYYNNKKQPIRDYSLPTLPLLFSENGYRTAAVGKMHFCPNRTAHGYNERITMEEIPDMIADDDYAMYLKKEGLGDVQNIHGVRPLIYHQPQRAQVDLAHYETKWVENETIHWLDRNGDAPFFLFVGFIKPHPPWNIPEGYEGLYADADLPEALPRSREFPCSNEPSGWYGDFDSAEMKRKTREAYYTACSMVDESVGSIIEHLRATGQLDNTLVLFTSDHGDMLGDKGYYSKNLPYDGSVRVPLIARYPEKFAAGSQNNALVDLLDLFPTCLELADLTYPKGKYELYGDSLFHTNTGKNRDVLLSADGHFGNQRWVMARTKTYKYIYHYNGGFEELYDLVDDPHELVNVMDAHRDSDIHHKLRAEVLAYEAQWGPEEAVVDGNLTILPAELLRGEVFGKFHTWSNQQFQRFQRADKSTNGAQFIKEIQYALSDRTHSGSDLKEVFNDPTWIEQFRTSFATFGESDDWENKLFPPCTK